jgi:hypothetical protein
MSFPFLFSLHTALGMVVGYLWFLIPGLLVHALVAPLFEERSRFCFAPLLGMATWGPVSVLLFNAIPFQPWALLASYAMFNGCLFALGPRVRPRAVPLVHVACGLIATIPCVSIYPFGSDGALYTGTAIHDHARVAFIDAIYRHGLPPLNPIFAPGQDVVFNYYYLWLFEAAQLRALTWIPGWPADVALTWLTFLAVSSACAGIAIELARSRLAPWAVVVLSACGPLLHALPWLRSIGWAPRNALATAVGQGAWSPHHLLAAGAIVLALYTFSRAADGGGRGYRIPFVLGSLLACAFGCSVWLVLALIVSAPFLLLAVLWTYRERPRALVAPWRLALQACLVALPLCIPVLLCAVAGPFAFQGTPIAFDVHRVLGKSAPAWLQLGLFWLWAVPLAYGASYLLGLAGVMSALRRRESPLFAALSLAGIAGFLLVAQLIRSVVMNNDLGWRAHTVANLLLIVWSAIGVDRVRRWTWLPMGLLVACGLIAAPLALPGPRAGEGAAVRAERERFLVQARAWQTVRRYAGPNEIVQSNPYAFNRLSPWPLNLGYMLFADRRSVFAHPNWVRTYAHNLPPELLPELERIVVSAFSKHPDPRALHALRDGFRVEVLLVDREDPVWGSDRLDQSGIYARAHSEPAFRIYVARRPN